MVGEAIAKARPTNIPSLKISFMMKTNILLITSVILFLHHITIASSESAIEKPSQFHFFQVGEGDLTRTSSAEATRHQFYLQEEDEGVDFEINVADQQKQDMPPIIVSEVQESSKPSSVEDISSNFRQISEQKVNDEDELNQVQSGEEPLQTRESRSNFIGIGISNDNDDDENNFEDEPSTSYHNILLSPQEVTPFAPSLINQQRQHLRNVLLQPMNNLPVLYRRVAPIQNAYLDEDRNEQPVNFIYVPASTLKQQNHHQPAVVLQELRSLQFHDKSPLLNILFQPTNSFPLQTNSVSWPSKYQADKYLPPDDAFSRLFVRSSPSHLQNPYAIDSFFRRFENPYEQHQLQRAEPLNNFIGSQPFYQNSNVYHHRYVVPQVPFFSSNVPLSSNFPPLPYVSPSLRGYKSETTTPPGDIDVRMSTMPDEFPRLPQPTQTQIDQPDNGLLNRALVTGSERDVEETTKSAKVEQRNFEEEIPESPVKYKENESTTTEIVNVEIQQENNDSEKVSNDNVLKNVTVSSEIEEMPTQTTATSTPVEKIVTMSAQSDENLIDSTENATTMMESSTTELSATDEMNTTMATLDDQLELTTTTMNSVEETMTTTEQSS